MIKADQPLGFWMCTSLIIGNVIGMGIFLLPAALAPYGLNALLGWGVTVIGCTFIAYVFAQLARALPQEDGPYGYMRRAFGGGPAFCVMWCYCVSIWITNATLVVGVVGYLTALIPALADSAWRAPAVALALIWLCVLINLRGARMSGRVQLVSTLLKLLPLLAVMLLGAIILCSAPQAYLAHVPATPLSWQATAAASTVSLFAMLGVECATIPAGKVVQPERTIPRATIAGTLVTAAVYVGVSAIPLLLLPQAQLSQSSAPFVDLFSQYWNAGSGRWLAGFVIVSGLGALNGWTLVAGEVTAAFASHGMFPAILKRHNRHGAPAPALLLMGLLASAMVAMSYSRTLAEGFSFLSVMVTAANMPLYLMAGVALIALWRRGKIGSNQAMLASAALATLYAAWASWGIGQESLLWAGALGAVSLPAYWYVRVRQKLPDTVQRSSL
ncbi:MAG: APC family permease [Sphingomonadaceae bacterium]